MIGIESKQKTGLLRIQSETLSGEISFRAGVPWTAKCADGTSGAGAIQSMLTLRSGTFIVDPNHRPKGSRGIDVDFSKLLRS